MRKKTTSLIFSIILSIIIVGILLSQINVQDIIFVLNSIEAGFVFLGLSLYICSYLFRTLRFNILLRDTVNNVQLFSIVCVTNIAIQIFPARTGEFSYIYLLKKNYNTAIGDGMSSLIISRVFDIIALGSLFIISVIFIENLPDFVHILMLFAAVIMASLSIVLVEIILRGDQFVKWLRWILNRVKLSNYKVIEYLLSKADETVDSFQKMRSRKQLFLTCIFSFLLWGTHCSMLYLLALGMKLALPMHLMLFAITFYLLTTFIPISTVGGFGIKEAGWALALTIIGVPKELAISSGFAFHIIVLGYTVLLGILGFLVIRKYPIECK